MRDKKKVFIFLSFFVALSLLFTTSINAYETYGNGGGLDELMEFIRPGKINYILNEFGSEEIKEMAQDALDPDNYPDYDGENYLETLKTDIPKLDDIYKGSTEPPEWADGIFAGVWGVGNDSFLGYFAGFYHQKNTNRGFYAGVWNTTDNSQTGSIIAFYSSIFTLGRINITEGNKFPVVGFLLLNQTHLAGRIMTVAGPPVWMYGVHQDLEEDGSNEKTKDANQQTAAFGHVIKIIKRINHNLKDIILTNRDIFRFSLIKSLLKL